MQSFDYLTFDKVKSQFIDPNKVVKIIPIDRSRAKRLRQYVATQGWQISQSQARWAAAFGILRRRLNKEHGLIDQVLDYVIAKKITKPKINNGAKLAKEDIWDWIVRLMSEDVDRPITPEAKKIATRIQDLGWPLKSKKALPTIAQMSLDNLKPFLSAVRERAKKYSVPIKVKYDPKKHPKWAKNKKMFQDDQRKYRYTELVFVIGQPTDFIQRYLKWLNGQMQSWSEFSGDVKAMVFKPDTGMGLRFGQNFGRWDQILEELKDG